MAGAGYESSCLAYPASLPEVFGPAVWWSVHTMAAAFPEYPSPERRSACAQFVRGLPGMSCLAPLVARIFPKRCETSTWRVRA